MKTNFKQSNIWSRFTRAFSLVEVMVGMAVMGLAFVALYGGISSGFQLMRTTREDLRATQVMVEKMETIRLCSWEQVVSGTNIPTAFTEFYYPLASTNSSSSTNSSGIVYYGSVAITNADLNSNYSTQMRTIVIQVRWTNYNIPRLREMRTYVARDGMQNYIF
jgi:prepilin-type N-terminal cleavage/methylation domain-containing protein